MRIGIAEQSASPTADRVGSEAPPGDRLEIGGQYRLADVAIGAAIGLGV